MSERPVITAAYESRCGECLETIFEGEEIALAEPDGEWCHLRCAEETEWPDD